MLSGEGNRADLRILHGVFVVDGPDMHLTACFLGFLGEVFTGGGL